MLPYEFGFVLIYVATFGFSDYFVKIMKLKDFYYLLYYAVVAVLGFYILYSSNYFNEYKHLK